MLADCVGDGRDRDVPRLPLMPYDRDKASECVTRLVGTRTSSHGGKCVVRRKGSLDEIPHVQRIRGVGIVPDGGRSPHRQFPGGLLRRGPQEDDRADAGGPECAPGVSEARREPRSRPLAEADRVLQAHGRVPLSEQAVLVLRRRLQLEERPQMGEVPVEILSLDP